MRVLSIYAESLCDLHQEHADDGFISGEIASFELKLSKLSALVSSIFVTFDFTDFGFSFDLKWNGMD